jgi:hypothetical protein
MKTRGGKRRMKDKTWWTQENLMILLFLFLALTCFTMGVAGGIIIGQDIRCDCKPTIKTIDTAPKCNTGELICVNKPK